MDWLVARQDSVERKLVRTHLSGAANPDRLALFDLSSSWAGGRFMSSRAPFFKTAIYP